MNQIHAYYHELLALYGPQGWWPLTGSTVIAPAAGDHRGYHPLEYDLPDTPEQIFEICLGAILTQSVSWISVEKALQNLRDQDALRPERLKTLSDEELAAAIRPAGYFNQKARKLRIFTDFFSALAGRTPSREELLGLWGIGPETADSILLYAFKVPTFVVDAYTRRLFTSLGILSGRESYVEIKAIFERHLPRDRVLFQEYHALIVEHAKRLRGRRG
jgi:endonuclease-3 related protein